MNTPLQTIAALDTSAIVPAVVDATVTALLFVVSFVVLYGLGKLVVLRIVRESLQRRGVERAIVRTAVRVTGLVIAVVAVALAATIAGFGVVLSAFAILGGALALAIGFATQDLIANFVAGIFILQDKPFTIGDWIKWDDEGGIVRDIDLRVTKVETFDNELVTVPNSDLANAAVTNPTANDRVRIGYDFGIGYGDDIDRAREAIIDAAHEIDGVLDEPAPAAPVTDLGGSAVVLTGRIWIDPSDQVPNATKAAFVEAVKKRLDEEDDIDFPYPTTELTGSVTVDERGEKATLDSSPP
ncbi:small-conductance mechanosensitive channel [Halovivax ruber XH-70]|uniref:Small-conductance mechanosensitive channel n=1 Tax=Halovivax ruber (strain DSM 18193 / JCM 13892 / XH-70) TaxID=797302 RepID=L0I948_HALRX|nr:mechanosensitive ion channel family protein [Halovivax ruber]AGB15234.1 small-conductance mechanosensitive channel [Halovivax ruber XH-70]